MVRPQGAYGLRVPEDGDEDDVPRFFTDLVWDIRAKLVGRWSNRAGRDSALVTRQPDELSGLTEREPGTMAFVDADGFWTGWDGGRWVNIGQSVAYSEWFGSYADSLPLQSWGAARNWQEDQTRRIGSGDQIVTPVNNSSGVAGNTEDLQVNRAGLYAITYSSQLSLSAGQTGSQWTNTAAPSFVELGSIYGGVRGSMVLNDFGTAQFIGLLGAGTRISPRVWRSGGGNAINSRIRIAWIPTGY